MATQKDTDNDDPVGSSGRNFLLKMLKEHIFVVPSVAGDSEKPSGGDDDVSYS